MNPLLLTLVSLNLTLNFSYDFELQLNEEYQQVPELFKLMKKCC